MDIKKLFEKQLKTSKILSESDILFKVRTKSLESPYQEGDKILFLGIENKNEINFITIADREFFILERDYDYIRTTQNFPIFKKKTK